MGKEWLSSNPSPPLEIGTHIKCLHQLECCIQVLCRAELTSSMSLNHPESLQIRLNTLLSLRGGKSSTLPSNSVSLGKTRSYPMTRNPNPPFPTPHSILCLSCKMIFISQCQVLVWQLSLSGDSYRKLGLRALGGGHTAENQTHSSVGRFQIVGITSCREL